METFLLPIIITGMICATVLMVIEKFVAFHKRVAWICPCGHAVGDHILTCHGGEYGSCSCSLSSFSAKMVAHPPNSQP